MLKTLGMPENSDKKEERVEKRKRKLKKVKNDEKHANFSREFSGGGMSRCPTSSGQFVLNPATW